MYQKRGFTLIELLVVVLIIGILSAVALPQYEKAVRKSRLANAIVAARAVKDAEERYYLANGEYTADMESLDIQIEAPKGFTLALMEGGIRKVELLPVPYKNYSVIFGFDQRSDGLGGVLYCVAGVGDVQANQLCASYGKQIVSDSDVNRYQIN